MRHLLCAIAVIGGVVSTGAQADGTNVTCPDAVSAAAKKAYADGQITSCKKELDHGETQYEVKLDLRSGKIEIDVSPAGKILQTEQAMEIAAVPPAVMKTFNAKYPAVAPTKANKLTAADNKVTYEVVYREGTKRHEVTFAEDGTFLEAE